MANSEAKKLATVQAMEEAKLKLQQKARAGLLSEQALILQAAQAAEQVKLNDIEKMEASRLKVAEQSAKGRAASAAVERDALLAQQALILKDAETANSARLKSVQQMEENQAKVFAAGVAGRNALAEVEVRQGMGRALTDLINRIRVMEAASGTATSSMARQLTGLTNIARTFSNTFSHTIAGYFNLGNSASRAAVMVQGHAAATANGAAAVEKLTGKMLLLDQAAKLAAEAQAALKAGELHLYMQKFEAATLKAAEAEKLIAAETTRLNTVMKVFGGVTIGIVAAATAVGGALLYAAHKAADYAIKIDDLRAATGVTNSRLQGLALAARESGVDFGQLEKSLVRLSSRLGQFSSGTDRFHKDLAALGITGKDVNSVLDQLSEKLGHASSGAERAALITGTFGRVAGESDIQMTKLLTTIQAMPGGLKAWAHEAELLYGSVTKGAQKEREFIYETNRLKVEWEAFVRVVGEKVIPAFNNILARAILIPDRLHIIALGFKEIAAIASGDIFGAAAAAGQAAAETKLWDDKLQALIKHFKDLGKAMGEDGPKLPPLETAAKGAHLYNDALKQLLRTIQDQVRTLQDDQIPAAQRINMAADRQIETARHEIETYRRLAEAGKISRSELSKREQEFTQIIIQSSIERELRLAQEAAKTHEQAQRFIETLKAKTQADQTYVQELGVNALTKIKARERAEEELIQVQSRETIQKLRLSQTDKDRAEIVEQTEARIQAARAKANAEIDAQVRKYIQDLNKQTQADRDYLNAFGQNQIQKIVARTNAETSRIRAQAQEEADVLRLMGLYKQAADVITAAQARIRAAWDKANHEINGQVQVQENRKIEQSYRRLQSVQGAAMRTMEATGKHSGRELVQVFRQLNDAVQHHKELTKEDMEAVAVATAAALVAFAGHQKIAAGIMVVWETAEGIRKLAEGAYAQAALHFLSAAEYGVIAGTSSKTSPATGGSSGGGGHNINTPGMDQMTPAQQGLLAPGAASSLSKPPSNMTIMVVGESTGAQYISRILNNYVQNQSGKLVSSHSTRPAGASTTR